MPFFNRRISLVEAIQFTGDNFFECHYFMKSPSFVFDCLELKTTDSPVIGETVVEKGDWIVKSETTGRFFSVTSDDFKKFFVPA